MKKTKTNLLTIKRIGINGEGIGYYKRKAVFVPYALPEEEILCSFTKEYDNYIEGKLIKLKKPSHNRVKAPCPYYEHCGGCQLQHLKYEEQLVSKRNIVHESLMRYLNGYESLKIELKNTIGLDDPYYYRNRAQMPVSFDGKSIVTGLYEINSNKLVYIDTCMIQHKVINEIIDRLKVLLTKEKVMVFKRKFNNGSLRYISVRYLETSDEAQVVLVLENKTELDKKVYEKIANNIMNEFKIIKSFQLNINSHKNHEIYGDEFIHIKGTNSIKAKIGELTFNLSAASFYQLNTKQTKVLYDVAKSLANLQPTDTVIDAYCGVGTIGQYVANRVKEVRGVDTIKQAIIDARENAKLNNLTNTHYEAGKAEDIIPSWINKGYKPNVLFMDPPRTGIDKKLLNLLKKIKVPKLIYISCNPSTLAKDLNELKQSYKIKVILPVDMFPQTSHVESIILMTYCGLEGK